MRKSNKKGFTVVELVIVIAIIAILAGVLIPTFAGLIQKANTNADIQACRQMNTYLAVNEVTEGKTIFDVYAALEEGGMTAMNYNPLSSNTYYFWDSTLNRILYTNSDYEVIFPEEYKDVNKRDHQWYSLSSTIAEDNTYVKKETETGGVKTLEVTIKSAEQLFSFCKSVNDAGRGNAEFYSFRSVTPFDNNIKCATGENIVINLEEDVDMMGAPIGLYLAKCNITINGKGCKITGVVNSTNFQVSNSNLDNEYREYGAGIIAEALGVNVTFNNLTIENSFFGTEELSQGAVLVGQLKTLTGFPATLTVNNVHINNCEVLGKKGIGGYVGQTQGNPTITITGYNTIQNLTLTTTGDEEGAGAAAIVGRMTDGTISGVVKYYNEIKDIDSSENAVLLDEKSLVINSKNGHCATWYFGAAAPSITVES